MVRVITQLLVGLMLLFGAATLFPKAFFAFKTRRTGKGMLYISLGAFALFFSLMAFYYAYLLIKG